MPTVEPTLETPVEDPPIVDEKAVQERQFVIDNVLDQLGRPANLLRVSANELWDRHYRVNVYCKFESSERTISDYSITDSFFVTVTDEGINSSPAIEQRYN